MYEILTLRESVTKMKRVYFKVLLLFIVLVISSTSAFAATMLPGAETNADNYIAASANISASGTTVTASGSITGKAGVTTRTTVNLYLQQYKNGAWTNVEVWSSTGYTVTRSLSKSKAVSTGYKYRTKAVCSAYAGTNKETTTKYSASISL